jgi:hypothetical protein
MARLKFKQKCKICKECWILVKYREYPICVKCHMRQIFAEKVEDKKFKFLNVDKKIYEQSRFLRNIRQSYLMYKSLTDKQIETFKKTVKDLKKA